MPQNRIIILAAAGLILLDVIWMLIRGKKNGFIGKEALTGRLITVVIAGYVTALALLAILWFREFGIFVDIILSGCAVLATELNSRQLLTQ